MEAERSCIPAGPDPAAPDAWRANRYVEGEAGDSAKPA